MSPYFGITLLLGCLPFCNGLQMKCQSKTGLYHVIGQIYADGCSQCECTVTGPKCYHGILCTGKRHERATMMKCRDSTGQMHHFGETYVDGCSLCECQAMGPKCSPNIMCLGKRNERDAAMTCHSWGMTHAVGDMYSNGCDLCTCEVTGPKCHTGLLCNMGKREIARETSDKSTSSCMYEGESHVLGETFSTGCHYCTCTEHGVRCLALPCGRRRRQSNGECSRDGTIYREGAKYVHDCQQCTCSRGSWKCDIYWMCELGK